MEPKLKVGIVGVSGYGGGELARLLLAHPHVQLAYVTSGTYAGKPLRAALPGAAPSDLVRPRPIWCARSLTPPPAPGRATSCSWRAKRGLR